jgi:hypothetical protein
MPVAVQVFKSRTEIEGRIAFLRQESAKLFEEHPDYDFDEDQVKTIRQNNDEMTELGKRLDSIRELEEMKDRVKEWKEVERPGVYGGGNGKAPAGGGKKKERPWWTKSIGEMVAESDAITKYRSGMKEGPESSLDIAWLITGDPRLAPDDVKEALDWSEAKALLTSVEFPVQSIRLPGVPVQVAFRTPLIQNMIPTAGTSQPMIPYLRETVATSGAAAVAEGAAKPESALQFAESTSPVRKVATVLPITDEILADAPALRGHVDNRLRLFLLLERERQLLLGSGVAPNLTGILNTAGIQTQAKGTDPTMDAFYRAMVKVTNVFMNPTAIVMHPNDWTDIRLLRTADGVYIWGSPMDAGPERMWSLPVSLTPLITEGTGLVGDFAGAAQQFIREGVQFAMSTEHSDFFVTNKVMLRVEMRQALVVFRPEGFCTVTGI